MKKFFTPARIMYFFGFIVLVIATVMNLTTKYQFISVIPYTKYVEATINSICAILCLILSIRPETEPLQHMVFFVEAFITLEIGFVGIATLLFSAGIILLFVNGHFITRRKRKIVLLVIYWTIALVGVYPAFGLKAFFFAIALTFFYLALFSTVYQQLKSQLSYLLPSTEAVETDVVLPPKGSTLKLSDYHLTERQIAFVSGSIKNGLTYETLGERYHVSTSVVKKDMAAACKLFGVTNREALRILLLQYKVEEQ